MLLALELQVFWAPLFVTEAEPQPWRASVPALELVVALTH